MADWVGRFGRIVAAPWAEVAWPETIVLDGTEFMYTNPRMGTTAQLFTVLAAWGYPTGTPRGGCGGSRHDQPTATPTGPSSWAPCQAGQ